MSGGRSVTPWFPVAVDPVHEGIYEVEYRQSRFLFRREWRDGVWAIPGAVLLPATRPKRWRGLTAPARTMPKDQPDNRPAVVGQVERPVRPAAEARWYCVSREGMATLCTDEEDAKEVAAESFVLYPNNGPYRVVQMVDRQQPLTRQQIDDVMTQHYPLSSLLRDEVDVFEACVRDIERLHGIGA